MGNKIWRVTCTLAGFFLIFLGVKEFDQAATAIPLFRGIFWMLIGMWNVKIGVEGL